MATTTTQSVRDFIQQAEEGYDAARATFANEFATNPVYAIEWQSRSTSCYANALSLDRAEALYDFRRQLVSLRSNIERRVAQEGAAGL